MSPKVLLAGCPVGFGALPVSPSLRGTSLFNAPHTKRSTPQALAPNPVFSLTRHITLTIPDTGSWSVSGEGQREGHWAKFWTQVLPDLLCDPLRSLSLSGPCFLLLQCWSLSHFCHGPCVGWKRISRWDFFGRSDVKAETPILWPPHAKS